MDDPSLNQTLPLLPIVAHCETKITDSAWPSLLHYSLVGGRSEISLNSVKLTETAITC